MMCATCGAIAGAGARFCASCGRPLRAMDDERRVVTVVFADIVGFTTLSERLDPERVKNLVDRCFDRLALDVTTFGGQVDKVIGDAMVALFGAPVAHEDDAERAVRAALRMQETLSEEAADMGQGLRIRIGVNTGEVLVGAMRAAGSVTAMGDVVNTASRLQTAARPGEVLVGPATYAATRRTIAYEPRGLVAAKGRDEPVDTWVAVAPVLPPGYRARRVDVPLLGRDRELDLLRDAVGASMEHERALLVLLVGDVGMGKSRLADDIAAWSVGAHRSVVREGRCVPYGEANVWWPVAEALRAGVGVQEGAGHDEAKSAVRDQLATVTGRPETDPEVERTAEGLLTLMGYDPDPEADPAAVREEAGRALGAYVSASSALRPVILQLSDLHWADDAVLHLVDDVFATVHHRPVVLLATARPALLDRWTPRPGRHNSIVLHLDPLGRPAATELLAALVGGSVPEPVAGAILDRSGGNPFFLEELVSLLDGDAVAEPGRVAALPDTLRGLVAARLDDLSPESRCVLQDASVIGQRGPLVGLRAMAREIGRDVDVDAAVAELVADEIMERDGGLWAFRSDLVREVAYQMITKAERAKSHLGIARYIEAAASAHTSRPPWVVDQLAHHYGTAVALAAELGPSNRTADFPTDLADQARRWVVEAADRARRDQAIPTAVRLYGQALDLLETVRQTGNRDEAGDADEPDTAYARDVEELRLRLARARLAVEAWDSATARRDVEAAQSLVDRYGDPSKEAEVLVVRGIVEHHEGDGSAAVATLSRAACYFADLGDDLGLGGALRERAMVQILEGSMVEAAGSASDAMEAFDRAGDRAGQGWAQQHLAWIAFVSGDVDEADQRLAAALDHFRSLNDIRGLAWSEGLLSWVRFQQGRVAEASALAEHVRAEADARNDPWASALMTLLVASIRLWSGRTNEAVQAAERSYRSFQSLSDRWGEGLAGATLGRALVMSGRVDEGFDVLTRSGAIDGRGPAGGDIARYAALATAVQVGEPVRAREVIGDLESVEGIGGDDPAVVLALVALQDGDVAAAARYLAAGPEAEKSGNRGAARAMLAAVAGDGAAGEAADAVAAHGEATYLDLATAEVAAALEAAASSRSDAGSDPASEARRRLQAAWAAVDSSQDVVARAVVAMADARIAERLGAPDAAERAAEADRLVARLGIEPTGWTNVFDLALDPVPV